MLIGARVASIRNHAKIYRCTTHVKNVGE